MTRTLRSRLKAGVALAAIIAQIAASAGPASAFCGFYVAKADGKMFNKSSKVVLARDGDETVITMASDYEGQPNEFALVVPVPTFIQKNQIGVVNTATIDHLDAYTAPRLVQYYDPDPCTPVVAYDMRLAMAPTPTSMAQPAPQPRAYPGVKIEARYDVAEYDVAILSAEQSDGLINYLNDNGYKIPAGASPVIGSYVRQKMHFFIAKVNVKRLNAAGRAYLRPLQVRYKTAKFMLPLRLGTVNAKGPQDLLVYAVTRRGRIEASNYRTAKVPSNIDVPLFVENDFPNFYKAAFERTVRRAGGNGVFVEYAWNLNWCDPCAAKPMSHEELSELGARWLGNGPAASGPFVPSGAADAFVTRLHVRYDAKSFPEDLNFIETADRENFQARYVMHHPFVGATCQAAKTYRASLPARFRQEAANAADLTGWPRADIESRMALNGQPLSGTK
jgi:hypothetical protein